MIESSYTNNEVASFNIESAFLGQLDYNKAFDIQMHLFELAKEKHQYSIIGLEHPAVISFGRRAASEMQLDCQIPQILSSRGGLVTVHSEGQLVIYPIIDLKSFGLGVKSYVCVLLKATQDFLLELGVESSVGIENAGLYTSRGKIAFCGIQVKNGISLHGISINVRNDLSLFGQIKICGVENQKLDRLQDYHINMTLKELFEVWMTQFRSRLDRQISCM